MNARPLSGVRVLDLSRVLAGPYASQILGDLGADVLKIELPERGDDTRAWGPPFLDGESVYFLTANRNKRSRCLDFTNEGDRQELLRLVGEADVLIENYKTGGLVKYGLDYASLAPSFPRLVYCSISGFGHSGPYAEAAGYDALIQAMGGLMSITGPDAETPTKVGVAITDIATGLYATIAILAALRERETSGMGQHCELALFDTQVSFLANVAMNFLATGKVPRALGNAHPTIVPYQSFATKDKPLFLAVGNDTQFASFCAALGEPWAADPRFRTNPARVEHRGVLVPQIASRLRERTRAEWLQVFEGRGFPVGPINDLGDLREDPHVEARGLFTVMDDGTTPCLRSPIRLSRTPIERYARPPRLGEHDGESFGGSRGGGGEP
jgi:crotonobetainyl-CoA:carnitine CoA-transferase CaiB-like acyl-CoA transferase